MYIPFFKDTLKDNILCRDESTNQPSSSMCLSSILAPIYFVIFVLMAQFVLVNVVVAVLMKHLDVKLISKDKIGFLFLFPGLKQNDG